MTNGIGKFWQRKLVYLSLFFGIAILTFAPNQIQTTKAQLFTKTIKNSVVLLAEAELYESEQQTEGLATRFDGLSKTTLAKRVDNYAATIQSRLESTEAVIIKIPKAATPSQIQKLLANLYLYDNETIAGELTGVILIGDLQLPTVQHNGETITSIYPYVDFILPRYTASSTEQNQEFFQLANDNLEPEIWHGVIKLENREQYASYFDKVSLTEAKEAAFTPTSPKLFVADLAEETRSLNAGLIGSYQNYLNFAKAKIYNNLTAAELKLAEQNLRSGLPDQVSDKIPNQSLPLDIFAGQSLQNLAKPVVAMFQSYFNRLTPVWENTGRS